MSAERACEECGGPINGAYGRNRGRPAKYCSAKCCNTFNLRKARERKKAAAQPAPPPATEPAAEPAAARPCDNGNLIRNQRHAAGARHQIDPTTCTRDYTNDEFEFLKAVERYKRECKRPWPTATELLQIAVSLGYRKVAPAGPLPGAK